MTISYRFGAFVFDPECGLTRDRKPVHLEPRAFDLLHYLLANNGRIVSREELNERIWDGRIVSDAALSTQVRAVRRALGDGRVEQRFVKTHPTRGFSFVAPVETGAPGDAARPGDIARADEPGAGHVSPQGPSRRIRRRPGMIPIGVAMLAVAILVAGWVWLADGPVATRPPADRALSIAVLPFENLSGDDGLDYLADAFTEELITDLSRIRDAFVISRSTTFTYRNKAVDAASLAAELGVRYVIEGSLRVHGEDVRINAQLIDGTSNSHLWSERYDRKLSSLFDVQDTVTGRIASVLRAELRIADNQRQSPEVARDAWDYALRGNVLLFNHQSVSDYQEAYALLTKAVTLDETISSAWTGLSFVHYAASVADIPGVSRPDSAALSLDAARKAVEADPMNAEPYWLVGAGYARVGQPERGMAACKMAIDLNPNMDCGYVCAGLVHMALNEPAEAVPAFQYALKLNPRFRPFVKEKYLGLAYLQSGRDDLAIETLNRALAKAPKDMFANLVLTSALALDGRMPAARKALERFRGEAGKDLPTLSALRERFAWLGPEVARMLDGLRKLGMPDR